MPKIQRSEPTPLPRTAPKADAPQLPTTANTTAAAPTAGIVASVVARPRDNFGAQGARGPETSQPISAVGNKPPEKAQAKYDYIVVGSGAGGAPAAARLAEAGYKVLVLEAGVDKKVAETGPLALHGAASEHKDLLVDGKGYFIRHRTDLAEDKKDPKFVEKEGGIFVPRGEGIGGSTRMNAGIFVRPDDVDWDNIAAATGDPSWKSGEMMKFFQKVENAEYQPVLKLLHSVGKGLGIDALQNIGGHGFDGWLKVNRPVDLELIKTLKDNPQLGRLVAETFKYNFTKVGSVTDRIKMLATLLDPNHDAANNREGMVLTPLTVTKDGARNGPRDRLLDAAAKHPDELTILSGAKVESFVLDDKNEATAVRYRTPDGKLHVEPFKRELVLSAGAFETPAIMMRSGVGPKAELEKLRAAGVEPKLELEGVGQNLKGRYEVGVVTRLKEPLPVLTETEFNADPNNPAYKKWQESGKGLFAGNGIVAAFRVKSDPSKPEPDLYVFGVPGNFQGYIPGYSKTAVADPHLITWVILDENKGDKKGTVTLDPENPTGRPKINQMFHGDEKKGDAMPLVNGIKIVRELAKGYADMIDGEVWPGDDVKSDADLMKAVEENSWDHHPNGTAQIGPPGDPMSVVDKDLKVIGLKGVRVSDASVFRENMGSFIQSAILTVSEKAASELIETAQKEDALGGHFSPWSVTNSKPAGAGNTLSDNLFILMHDTRKVGQGGVLSEGALKELVELTGKKGFSKKELEDAQTLARALNANGDPNARVVSRLADAIATGRADQGFLLDIQARLDDVSYKSSLPSLKWADKPPAAADVARWKTEITNVQKTLKAGNVDLTEISRGFHQKQLYGGAATAKVRADVPDFLRFGPFEKAGATLSGAVRFSNGQGCPFKDSAPDVRGAALKLFDDKGKSFDVLMTNQKAPHARDAEQFMKFARFSAVSQTQGNARGLALGVQEIARGGFDGTESARIAGQLARDTVLHRVESLATETYNGGTFRAPGGQLCKIVLMPADGAEAKKIDKSDPNWMGKELDAQLAAGPVKMVVGVQVYTGDGKNPDPTDASAEWKSPIYPVADLELPKPGANKLEVAKLVDKMAFNPANGFDPTHMTTARKEIYEQSAQNRGAISQDEARAGLKRLGVIR